MNHLAAEKTALLDFGHGLLFALSEKTDRIRYEDWKNLHKIFGVVFAEAAQTMPSHSFEFLSSLKPDPVHGYYREAQIIIFEGEEGTMLERGHGILYLDLNKEQARSELQKLAHAFWFRNLAELFLKTLGERNPKSVA